MAYVPVQIPPGVYRNGTDLQSMGRWRDASLVRWNNGVMQPVGGWSQFTTETFPGIPRGAVAWSDNDSDRWVAVGVHDGLHVVSGSGAVSDITPVGLTTGSESAVANTGYGGFFYGLGTYGEERPDVGTYNEATTWSLGTWGQYLVACSNADGKLYEWQLSASTPAAQIANSPEDCVGLVVTPERFLFALGADGDPRLVKWCDQGDNTEWTAAATNQAGDQLLEARSDIVAGLSIRGQTLILTRDEAYTATYLGPPFVYGFERVGTACGLLARRAAAQVDGGAIWMGPHGFHGYFGGQVVDIDSDVADYVFRNLNQDQRSKVHCFTNAMFNEVWWVYPQGSECDSYVAYNWKDQHWLTGTLDRVCGVDRGAFRRPMMFDSSGTIYEHEEGTAHTGASVYAETGPIAFGSDVVTATSLIPDELTQGQVTATFKTRLYPNGTETSSGPYAMSNPTSLRVTGRQVRIRVDGTDTDWRVGVPRLDVRKRGIR